MARMSSIPRCEAASISITASIAAPFVIATQAGAAMSGGRGGGRAQFRALAGGGGRGRGGEPLEVSDRRRSLHSEDVQRPVDFSREPADRVRVRRAGDERAVGAGGEVRVRA